MASFFGYLITIPATTAVFLMCVFMGFIPLYFVLAAAADFITACFE